MNCELRITNYESSLQIQSKSKSALPDHSLPRSDAGLRLCWNWEDLGAQSAREMPLKYSQGRNPRPKRIHWRRAAGCGCDAGGWMWLKNAGRLGRCDRFNRQSPDLSVIEVHTVPEDEAALSEQLVAAEYRVWLRDVPEVVVESAIAAFLDSSSLSLAKRGRKYRGKTYDLRPLVEVLRSEDAPAPWTGLWMRVKARPGATGRPDEVLKALDLIDAPRRCTRTRLILAS